MATFNIGTLNADITANAIQFNNTLNQVQQTVNNVMNNITSSVNTTTNNITIKMGGAAKKSSEGFAKMAEEISRECMMVGNAINTYISKPLTDLSTKAVLVGNKFETEMSRITGLVGVPKEEVAKWSNELIKLGPSLGKSPQELAEALYFISSSGFSGAEAMQVLVVSAKASAAGLGTTKVVADAVTSAVNAYGKEALSAARATDILVAAVREGKSEASEFAAVVGRVTPQAKAMGVDFAEMTGALAAMTRIGTTARQAGVGLVAFLGGIQKPTDEAEKKLERYKLTFHQLREMLKEAGGVFAVMQLLQEKFKGDEEAFGKIFGDQRELRTVFNLLSQAPEVVKAIFAGVRASVGDLDRAFQAFVDTNAFKFLQMSAQISTSMIEIGMVVAAHLVPVMELIGKALKEITDGFGKLDPTTKHLLVTVGVIGALVGPLLIVMGLMAKMVSTLALLQQASYLAIAAFYLLRVSMLALPFVLVTYGIQVLIHSYYDTAGALKVLNAEMVRHNTLQEEMNKLNESRNKKTLDKLKDIENPMERMNELEEEIDQANKELKGKKNTAKNKEKLVEETTSLIPDWLPIIGPAAAAPRNAAEKELAAANQEVVVATKRVEELTAELEKASKEADKFGKGLWRDSKIRDAIEDTTKKLREQADTFFMTRVEAEKYKLALKGAKDEEMREIDKQGKRIETKERYKDAIEGSEKIRRSIENPKEKFDRELKDLDAAFDEGTLSVDHYSRAYTKLKQEMEGANKELHKFDSASSNSNEALDRISKWRDKMKVDVPDMGRVKKKIKDSEGGVGWADEEGVEWENDDTRMDEREDKEEKRLKNRMREARKSMMDAANRRPGKRIGGAVPGKEAEEAVEGADTAVQEAEAAAKKAADIAKKHAKAMKDLVDKQEKEREAAGDLTEEESQELSRRETKEREDLSKDIIAGKTPANRPVTHEAEVAAAKAEAAAKAVEARDAADRAEAASREYDRAANEAIEKQTPEADDEAMITAAKAMGKREQAIEAMEAAKKAQAEADAIQAKSGGKSTKESLKEAREAEAEATRQDSVRKTRAYREEQAAKREAENRAAIEELFSEEAEDAAKEAEAAAKKAEVTREDDPNKKARESALEREDEEHRARKAKEKADGEPLVPKQIDVTSLTDDKGSILDILKSIAATNAAMAKKNNMEIEPANLVA